MITRAIVEGLESGHRVRVRIPIYNKSKGANGATPITELYVAPISVPQGIVYNPSVGDIVFVEFEEDEINKPVVIGYLSSKANSKFGPDILANSVDVVSSIRMLGDISLGDNSVTRENLECLVGLRVGLAAYLSNLDIIIDTISRDLKGVGDKATSNASDISILDDKVDQEIGSLRLDISEVGNAADENSAGLDSLWGNFKNFYWGNSTVGRYQSVPIDKSWAEYRSQIESLVSSVKDLKDAVKELNDTYINKSSPNLVKGKSYGTTMPSNPTEGQLFFKI